MATIDGQTLTPAEEEFLMPRLEGIADSVHQLRRENEQLRRALQPSCCTRVTAAIKSISLIATGVLLKIAYDYMSAATNERFMGRYDDKPLNRLF